MQALAEEWKRRDREREALVNKKVESSQLLTDIHNVTKISYLYRLTRNFNLNLIRDKNYFSNNDCPCFYLQISICL